MNKCLIILSHVEGVDKMINWNWDYDSVICADGGLLVAETLGIEPDLLIGDYDSMYSMEAITSTIPNDTNKYNIHITLS